MYNKRCALVDVQQTLCAYYITTSGDCQSNFPINPPFVGAFRKPLLRDSLRGAILGASNPQNRVNAPENPQASDFRERSHSSFTNCLLCNKHSFNRACSFDCFAKQAGFCQLVPFDCWTAVKDRFAISLLARLCCLKSTQTLGENSCFPPDPFSAFLRVFVASLQSRGFAAECLRRFRTFF